MKTTISVRDPAMDIIRCIALVGVVSMHFFLKTDFYYVYISGFRMYLLTILYCMSQVCVPLFLLLSGYLLNQKKPNRQYFFKLTKTLTTYLLASICCYLYAHFFAYNAANDGTLGDFFRQTLSFQAAPYSWYINMYIGLFLLIPYLNLIFYSLPGEKSRRQLLFVLLILTALPGVLNVFSYNNQWLLSRKDFVTNQFFPNYWVSFYPVTYYFLGVYLKEHPLKIKHSANLLLILAAFFINGTVNYFLCQNDIYHNGPWQEWGALPNVIQSVLVFQFLAQGNYQFFGPRTRHFLGKLSTYCLGAYLVSWIFDSIFYRFLHTIQPTLGYQLPFYPVMILLVTVCSLALSAILELCIAFLTRLLSQLHAKIVSN